MLYMLMCISLSLLINFSTTRNALAKSFQNRGSNYCTFSKDIQKLGNDNFSGIKSQRGSFIKFILLNKQHRTLETEFIFHCFKQTIMSSLNLTFKNEDSYKLYDNLECFLYTNMIENVHYNSFEKILSKKIQLPKKNKTKFLTRVLLFTSKATDCRPQVTSPIII